MRQEPREFRILWMRAPLSESAKGPWRREHPPGRVTKIVAYSFRITEKSPPRKPKWLRARGIRRRVTEDCMGPEDRASVLYLTDSIARVTKSEPLVAFRRHDYFSVDLITMSITYSFFAYHPEWHAHPPGEIS